MDDVIRLYVATALGHEDADDDALEAALRRAGIPAALAARLVVLGPIAFGRVVLRQLGVGLAESSIDREPDFLALVEHAERAGRDPVRVIGLRSAEINAVNNALNAGSRPEDLQLGPPMLGAPLPPLPPVPPDLFGAKDWLDQVLHGHGTSAAWEVAVFPRVVQPNLARLQLDLRVPVGERWLVESFAGTGETLKAAVDEAFAKLMRASLHVLLAAFVDESLGADQIEWEQWGKWRVCSGALLLQFSQVENLGFGAFLDDLRGHLPELSDEPHWLRVYHARRGDEVVAAEVLLDNETWPEAQEALTAWRWPRSDDLYAFRHFVVLLPTR